IDARESIAVYGDFDVDGVTASVILIESLQALGGNVRSYIPNRFSEGYGVNIEAIESLAGDGVSLIITADCGTGSVREISRAGELGVDVIVLDHHTVPPELPPTVALINPKRSDATYPEPELSSGGLAYRVMQLLYKEIGQEWQPGRYLDLAALSTVCDMAPLRGENRWLVREGLRALANTTRPGLRAMLQTNGSNQGRVTADTIGFTVGPRLNAAGRLADASLALNLLMEEDENRAQEIALELSRLNQQRQAETQRSLALARTLLADEDTSAPLLFVGHEDIPPGIVGLIAGRLTEEHYRPAVVFCRGETESRASCRSIPELDITAALRQCEDLLVRFGGHRAAAGFTVANDNLPALKQALVEIAAEQLSGVELQPVIDIDATIPLGKVKGSLIRSLSSLAPFGIENPVPIFLSRDVEVKDVRVMGADGTHLRLILKAGGTTWPAVAFGFAQHNVQTGQRLDVVYTFSADGGRDGAMELRITDFAPSA
ncbi:MAG: single-stranded-DNA-specific exonuclease RecJ, partial [Dehalococcoidia bacterium]